MPGPISNAEADKLLGTRLEYYRLAVLAGFFNEAPATTGYKGFQIMPADGKYLIMQNGVVLMSVQTVHIAKIWVTCRVQGIGIVEANTILRSEK